MPRDTFCKLYYAIANPKVDDQYIQKKFSECNTFQVISNLLTSENLKLTIAQLCNKLQFCNFTVIVDPKVGEFG